MGKDPMRPSLDAFATFKAVRAALEPDAARFRKLTRPNRFPREYRRLVEKPRVDILFLSDTLVMLPQWLLTRIRTLRSEASQSMDSCATSSVIAFAQLFEPQPWRGRPLPIVASCRSATSRSRRTSFLGMR
jgi:hypothetical protein